MEHRLRLLAVAVLLGGLALTSGLLLWLYNSARASEREVFVANARNVEAAVTDRVETAIALLRGVAGLMASQSGELSLEGYRAYMDKLALRERYAGLLGIGFSRRLQVGEVPELEGRMRAEGLSEFRLWPEPDGDEAHAIVFLEPLDERNAAAMGYDMYSAPVRREAMQRARDSGEAASSGIVELVQEIDAAKQPGFLIYLPVYRDGEVPATLAERREALLGFSYVPIRAVDFLSRALATAPLPFLGVEIHLGEPDEASLLYAAGNGAEGRPRFAASSQVLIAGQTWTFRFRSATSLTEAWSPLLLPGLAGIIFSALLAMLLWRETAARERVHAALAREQGARSQAERANRMKDQFLATLSHELRTPLTAIVGWAAVLRQGGLGQDKVISGVDTIDRNARALAGLIDDLLDMNRIAAGKVNMRHDKVNLATVLEDALDAVAAVAAQKGLRVQQHLAQQSLLVLGDAARLQQVFWNLLSNAVKFTPEGGRIDIALSSDEECAHVRVSDTGEGIDSGLLEHIFDPFAQAETGARRRHGGLGLGLAIARQLVQMHGGTIRARSEGEGRGASFEVSLPLLDHQTQDAQDLPALDEAQSLRGLRILVVDDEPDVRELLRMLLVSFGAEVNCFSNGREALVALQDSPPDLLLSDIGMPGMNGYELLRALRRMPTQRGGATPAIALTAYAREEDRQAALDAGYQLHLAKPVRPDQLQRAVLSLTATRKETAGARSSRS